MRRSQALGAMAGLASLLLAGAAQARTELLRWQHPNPSEVAGFTVHVGTSTGRYGQQVDAGLPVPQNGIYTFNLTVADTQDAYVAISARGTNGLSSPPSNERFRPAPASPPPPAALGAPGRPIVVTP